MTSSTEMEMKWNLDNIFSTTDGGRDFFSFIDGIRAHIVRLKSALSRVDKDEIFAQWQMISASLRHAFAFIACLGVEDQFFSGLQEFQQELIELEKEHALLTVQVDSFLASIAEADFEKWVGKKENAQIASLLRARKKHLNQRMSPEKELLALSLSRESFVPIADIYRAVASRLAVHVPDLGPLDVYSAQTFMRERSPSEREKIFNAYESAWKKQGSIFRTLLNQVYGYRVELMRQRGHLDPLGESLYSQRVTRQSVDTMWKAINNRKASLIVFLNKKALFFKNKKATWTDIWADLIQENKTPLRLEDATQWVHAALSRIGPEVADFCRSLAKNEFITNRGMNKIGINSFTLPLPLNRQVRIFLGYGNDIEHLVDYGRQLANAWRYHVLFDYPEMLQHCPLIVAEAFQVFTERLVLEVVKERAFSRQQQFDALYSHVQKAAVSLLDMQVRYIFESRLFTERAHGPLSEDRLCDMMSEAQRIAYAGQLASYFPYYWASKDHFYHTTAPAFQNYPQTMGYLIGLALYRDYKNHPQGFPDRIKKWLQEATIQSSIENSLKHTFGLDLSDENLWNQAIDMLESDVRSLANLMEIKDKTFALEMKGY